MGPWRGRIRFNVVFGDEGRDRARKMGGEGQLIIGIEGGVTKPNSLRARSKRSERSEGKSLDMHQRSKLLRGMLEYQLFEPLIWLSEDLYNFKFQKLASQRLEKFQLTITGSSGHLQSGLVVTEAMGQAMPILRAVPSRAKVVAVAVAIVRHAAKLLQHSPPCPP